MASCNMILFSLAFQQFRPDAITDVAGDSEVLIS